MSGVVVMERSLAPQWKAIAVIVVSMFACLLMGIAVVQSVDTAVYDSLPPAMLALAGIPAGASISAMVYAQMLGFLGAITVAGFAVAVGARMIAGEEKDGTLSLLLSYPVSRLGVGMAKVVALVLAVAAISLGLWGAGLLAGALFDIALGDAHLGELCLALGANAVVCGAGAFAVGGVTGRRQAATGIGAMLVGLGWLFAGLLPQWSQTKDVARFIPWYWYSEPSVLLNGLDAGYMALMIAVATVLFVVGIVGLNVRDLRGNLRGTLFAQRIQHVGWVRQAVKGTSATGRGLYSLLVLRHAGLLVVLGVVMFAVMGLLMGPIYQQMSPQLETASQSMPPVLLQVWGATDMASPTGFYWGETMSLMAPTAVIVAGAAVASRLGADEHSGQLGLVLSTPVRRIRLLGSAAAAQATLITIVAVLTGLGVWGGARLGGMNLTAEHIAGATVHLLALGLCMGAVSMLGVAAFGTPSAGTWAAAGVGVVGYALNITLPMNSGYVTWARISPFYWYGAVQPLENGVDWGHVAILMAGTLVLLAVSFFLFARRDLHS